MYRTGRGGPGGTQGPPQITRVLLDPPVCCVVLWGLGVHIGEHLPHPHGVGTGGHPPIKEPPGRSCCCVRALLAARGAGGARLCPMGHGGSHEGVSLAWLGLAWLGLARLGLAWLSSAWLGPGGGFWPMLTRLSQRWLVSAHPGSLRHLLASLGTVWPTLARVEPRWLVLTRGDSW